MNSPYLVIDRSGNAVDINMTETYELRFQNDRPIDCEVTIP